MPNTVDTPLILSKSAFAARRSVSVSAVCKWVERRRIYGEALTADGRVNITIAERQLGVTLDAVRSAGKIAAAAAADAAEPVSVSVREQMLEIDFEQKRRRLEVEKGVYVRATQVRAERGKALAEMIAAMDQWIASLAGELGLDRPAMAKVQASWRHFREGQADRMLAEAEKMPELLIDAA